MLGLRASEREHESRNEKCLSDLAYFQWGKTRKIRFISSNNGATQSSPIDPVPDECQTIPTTEIPASGPDRDAMPWNLRKRRAVCKPIECKAIAKEIGVKKKVTEKKMSFSISLSKKEIEEDFMSMIGEKPSRKHRKRPRSVQKYMDSLFPGLMFDGINVETYKV